MKTIPEGRRRAVRQQLDLISRAVQRAFPEPEDRARAAIADHQGIGPSGDAVHAWGPPPSDHPRADRVPARDLGRRVPSAGNRTGDDERVMERRRVSGP